MSLLNIEKYLLRPEEVVSRTSLTSNGDGTWSATETEGLLFSTSKLIQLKRAMKARIEYANTNLTDGAQNDEIARCTPIYEWVNAAIDDTAEAAYESQFNPLN